MYSVLYVGSVFISYQLYKLLCRRKDDYGIEAFGLILLSMFIPLVNIVLPVILLSEFYINKFLHSKLVESKYKSFFKIK